MDASQELIAKVELHAKGTPYIVERKDYGFDIRVDVSDARCYGLLHKEGIEKVFMHHVDLNADEKSLTIVDDAYHLEWQLDPDVKEPDRAPTLKHASDRTVGHVIELGARKEFAWDERGKPGEVLAFNFSSSEGRNLVHAAAKELGWHEETQGVVAAGMTKTGIALIVILALVLVIILLIAI